MENRSHALIAGLFTVLLGLAALGALWWFGDSDEETRDYLVVTTRTVSGLNVQGQVRYRGIRVGKAADIRLDPNDVRSTLIRIAIDRDIPLTAGTTAQLGYQGVTGIAHVLLDDDGSDPRPLLGEGGAPARIPMQESLMQGLADNGREVLRQARELMLSVNALLDADNRRRISNTLANLEATTAEARAATAQLRSVLTSENVQKLEATLNHAEHATAQAGPFFAEARGLVARLQAVGDKLDVALGEPGSGQSAGLLPRVDDLTRELSASSRQLGRVLQMLEESPQSLIFGRPEAPPGPGEPGFSAPSAAPAPRPRP